MQNTEFQALKNDGEKWMMIHSWVVQGHGWGYWHQDLSRLAKAGCTLRVVVGLDEGIIQFAPLERKDAEDETHGHASCSWTHCLKYRRKPPLLQTPYRCHAETQTSYNGWHPDRHFFDRERRTMTTTATIKITDQWWSKFMGLNDWLERVGGRGFYAVGLFIRFFVFVRLKRENQN